MSLLKLLVVLLQLIALESEASSNTMSIVLLANQRSEAFCDLVASAKILLSWLRNEDKEKDSGGSLCERVILNRKFRQLAVEDVLLFCEFKSLNKISFWLVQNKGNSLEVRNTLTNKLYETHTLDVKKYASFLKHSHINSRSICA